MNYLLIGLAFSSTLLSGVTGVARSNALPPLVVTAPAQSRISPRATIFQPNVTHLTVASVRLTLKTTIVDASVAGQVTQLLLTAFDPAGKVIVGPGTYFDTHGNPLVIRIANSSPTNTTISPASFSQPLPSGGASNVATVTYSGRAHFHYPTFSVKNAGLPSTPSGGVTLIYAPSLGNFYENQYPCIAVPSVGGYVAGPYFADTPGCQPASPPAVPPLPATADIWRAPNLNFNPPYITYNVNPLHNGVVLGFGSDKRVYFAYNASSGPDSPTVFGYLNTPVVAPSMAGLSVGNVGPLWHTSANVSSVSGLTLGNDGSLWFAGLWHGKVTIGKLPPAGASNWRAQLYSLADADSIFSIEPGYGNSEALLYSAHGRFYVGTIRTDLTGFKGVRVLTGAGPGSGYQLGDLLAGPDGSFYISAIPAQSNSGSVYKITAGGNLISFCQNVQTVYRLSDGTGAGYFYTGQQDGMVHVVPGQGCTRVPVFPLNRPYEVIDLYGVDTTTEDWIFYSNPNGHRGGIF